MKKIMALTAAVSVLALFVLTSQAHAQEATVTADPEYVSSAGTHTIALSGSGFQNNVGIAECPGWNGSPPADINQGSVIAGCAPSVFSPHMATVSGGSFSTSVTVNVPASGLVLFVFHQNPDAAVAVVIKIGEPPAEDDDMDDMDDMDDADMDDMDDMDDMADDDMADDDMGDDDMGDDDMADDDMADDDMADMGDDMVPEGPAATGFGGSAGSDGNGIAVPLAATLAAAVLLGGAAIVTRRSA